MLIHTSPPPHTTSARPWPSPLLARLAALACVALLLAGELARHPGVLAQSGITVLAGPPPSVVFGQVIVFELSARSADEISKVTLHLQAGEQAAFDWTDVAF